MVSKYRAFWESKKKKILFWYKVLYKYWKWGIIQTILLSMKELLIFIQKIEYEL